MTKEELAEQFAEQKAEELTSILKDAYLKGYEHGRFDANRTLRVDGVTYVDLGLPSGTLWSKTALEVCNYGYGQRQFSYQEAIQLQLPTIEQWDEVRKYCRFDDRNIIGPSGERIGYGKAPAGYLIRSLGEGCEKGRNMFWLKGEVDEENNAPVMVYDLVDKEPNYEHIIGKDVHFIGYELPVFLVKNKE